MCYSVTLILKLALVYHYNQNLGFEKKTKPFLKAWVNTLRASSYLVVTVGRRKGDGRLGKSFTNKSCSKPGWLMKIHAMKEKRKEVA